MNLFPKTTYQKKTTMEVDEIRVRLNTLLASAKYDGCWVGNRLLMQRNNEYRGFSYNNITPQVTVSILEIEGVRVVSAEFQMKPNFVFLMGLMIVLMGILQLFMIYAMIANQTFNVVVFAPVFFLMFIYFILFMCNLWDSDGFRYDLNKVLK